MFFEVKDQKVPLLFTIKVTMKKNIKFINNKQINQNSLHLLILVTQNILYCKKSSGSL